MYLIQHLCKPVRAKFAEAAALAGVPHFPTMAELLADRHSADPVEWQTPEWEWVDPQNEQKASQASIDGLQSTYQTELGSRGRNWRQVFHQRAKEERLKDQLGLTTIEEAKIEAKAAAPLSQAVEQPALPEPDAELEAEPEVEVGQV